MFSFLFEKGKLSNYLFVKYFNKVEYIFKKNSNDINAVDS